jgi:hypothetical protein
MSLITLNNNKNDNDNDTNGLSANTTFEEEFSNKLDLSPSHSFIKNDSFFTRIDTNFELSFLLSIFDNIVGPKCVHFWSSQADKFNNSNTLKYISVNTLNGELYSQDKLFNSSYKYKIYLIKEIDYAILAIFFDANTMDTTLFGGHSSASGIKSKSRPANDTSQLLNCFSIIVPLEQKKFLLDFSSLIMSFFEQSILEYKVFAEISERKDKITTALSYLTQSINRLCFELSILIKKGLKNINVRGNFCRFYFSFKKY